MCSVLFVCVDETSVMTDVMCSVVFARSIRFPGGRPLLAVATLTRHPVIGAGLVGAWACRHGGLLRHHVEHQLHDNQELSLTDHRLPGTSPARASFPLPPRWPRPVHHPRYPLLLFLLFLLATACAEKLQLSRV